MNSVLPVGKLLGQLKRILWIWVALAVLAAAVVVVRESGNQSGVGVAKAVVTFSYDGIESGKDPLGNRFDPSELKSEEVIAAAVETLGLDLDDKSVAEIRNSITVNGSISSSTIGELTEYKSVFESGTPASTTEVRSMNFFPTKFTVSFPYAQFNYNAEQGTELLREILAQYEKRFYERNGYNSSFERSVKALDYNNYDYEMAVEVLSANLTLLEGYLTRLAQIDESRFVSSETGYSFSDLLSAAETIKTNDLFRISSYVSANNMTKSRWDQIDYYEYKAKTLERDLEARQKKLETLDELIESYKKTRAVVAWYTVGDSEGSATAGYEITQYSKTYDQLVAQRIDCRVEISSLNEKIALFKSYAERLRSDSGTGNASEVAKMFENASDKLNKMVKLTGQTANEYFKTVLLKQAFEVNSVSDGSPKALTATIHDAKSQIITAEIFLLGAYLLCATVLALLPRDPFGKKNAAVKSVEPNDSGKQKCKITH